MIRIETKPLVDLLGDLVHTATAEDSLPFAGVLLHSARGYADPSEPGQTDLLVGTSSTGRHVGHTWCDAYGQMPPMLWPLDDVHAVITVFKRLAKGQKDHAVDIRRDGDEITVAEDPKLFGETSLRFTTAPLDDYPRQLWDLMNGTYFRVKLDAAPMPRTDLDHAVLTALGKVARRHGAPIQTYQHHHRRPILIQIGDCYRGVVLPTPWDRGETSPSAGEAPGGDLYPPTLPDPDAES